MPIPKIDWSVPIASLFVAVLIIGIAYYRLGAAEKAIAKHESTLEAMNLSYWQGQSRLAEISTRLAAIEVSLCEIRKDLKEHAEKDNKYGAL